MSGIKNLHDLIEIQGRDGNWDHDEYMFGMYNGMELALATIEGREPKYKERPNEWYKARAFTCTAPNTDFNLTQPAASQVKS